MRRHDEASALGKAHRTGLEEGFKKGHNQGKTEGMKIGEEKGKENLTKEIAARLKKMNMSQDQIDQILNYDK